MISGSQRKLPHFDGLPFLGASISRYPLERFRERCDTNVVLGARFAKKTIELKKSVIIAGAAAKPECISHFAAIRVPQA